MAVGRRSAGQLNSMLCPRIRAFLHYNDLAFGALTLYNAHQKGFIAGEFPGTIVFRKKLLLNTVQLLDHRLENARMAWRV